MGDVENCCLCFAVVLPVLKSLRVLLVNEFAQITLWEMQHLAPLRVRTPNVATAQLELIYFLCDDEGTARLGNLRAISPFLILTKSHFH